MEKEFLNMKIKGFYRSKPFEGFVTLLSEPKYGKKGWFINVKSSYFQNNKARLKISETQAQKISDQFNNFNKTILLKKNPKEESIEEIAKHIKKRFEILESITCGATKGHVYSIIVTGSPGIGKSFSVIKQLENLGKIEGTDFIVVKGHITSINLYRLMYEFKDSGKIIIIDDADSILFDENALNILKSGLDSDKNRRISWMSDALKNEDVPKTFIYEGSIIFLSNINFQKIIDEGKSKILPHLNALMSRSLYLDLNLWSRKEILAWIEYVVKNNEDFCSHISKEDKDIILSFTKENIDKFRTISIREIKKLIGLYLSDSNEWKNNAEILLMKNKQ